MTTDSVCLRINDNCDIILKANRDFHKLDYFDEVEVFLSYSGVLHKIFNSNLPGILPYFEEAIIECENCQRKVPKELLEKGVAFSHELVTNDFLLSDNDLLEIPDTSLGVWIRDLGFWLYNHDSCEIILEIAPVYPYHYSDTPPESDLTFEKWILQFEPILKVELSKLQIHEWLTQCRELRKMAKEAFR